MNILVISQYYYPENFRINDICEELVRRGNKVTVVAGIPNYPEGVVYKGYEDSYKKSETINGVKVIRCKNRPRKKGHFNLLLNYYSYANKAKKVVKRIEESFDVVYAYQMSPISLVLPAIVCKKKQKIPLYIYVCDIWPESLLDIGEDKKMSKKNPLFLFFKHLSKRIYKSADLIGAKCHEFIEYLNATFDINPEKCLLNYEHAENNYLSVKSVPIDNGIIDFMFLGNLGHSSNCSIILLAAKKIANMNFKIHFVGDGSELDNLKKLSKNLEIDDKIVFHGRVSQKDVIAFYDFADACLLTLMSGSTVGSTPPAKLTSYMASCRPIIAAITGSGSDIIKKANCGVVCDPNDVDGFAKLMGTFILNNELFKEMGMNGRRFFLENYTIDKHIDILEKHLHMVVKK